jgi:hypothetical protein
MVADFFGLVTRKPFFRQTFLSVTCRAKTCQSDPPWQALIAILLLYCRDFGGDPSKISDDTRLNRSLTPPGYTEPYEDERERKWGP